jgi:flagellar motor switch protein FliM
MHKLLGQDEIDAMVRAARGGANFKPQRSVLPCDFRQAGQLHREDVTAISGLHEGFARNLTHWLAAFLRVGFACNLVSVEQLTFNEVAERLPELAYLASLVATPGGSQSAMQLELSVAFPMIDLLLGGPGRPGPQRDLTAIEEQLFEDVVKIICRELSKVWQPIGLEFEFEERQQPQTFSRFMPPNELILALSFELRIAESQGSLQMVFPAMVADTLLRKLAREWNYQKKPRGAGEASKRLMQHLGNCHFDVDLALPMRGVPASQLVELGPGSVVRFRYPAEESAEVRVAGRPVFSARVARHQQVRVAQVCERLNSSGATEKMG